MDTPIIGAAIENLYPALLQCFAVILSGYAAGRMNLISETEAKGMNTFVGTFSLPALIFMSLAELDLSSVNWKFLLAILVAKTVIFGSVIIVTLLVGRSLNLARAGIFAIFCTQSNDFAIGYPIVAALYKNTHPEYASYLYLVAPINLAILNPIAFILMEIHKRRSINDDDEEGLLNQEIVTTVEQNHKRFKIIITIAKNIFLNPIIFMTILGIIGNFIFKHKVPAYLGGILNVLGSAFSASSLFLLGLRMVGKIHKLTGATLVVPGILIMVKLIVLPVITREMVNVMDTGSNSSETLDLSTYGFFYGTFPTAPGVFVFATQYIIDIDLIASAMVACTFISAPLMFVSAKMITITNCNPSEYIQQLDKLTFDISIFGILASIWIVIVFSLTKKISKIPHKITTCLVVSHFISCLGAILWNTIRQNDDNNNRSYIQFAIFTIGVYSSRIWTAILAITLLFLQCRSLCFVLKLLPLFFGIGWGVPILLCAVLLIFDNSSKLPFEKENPNFAYGASQAIVAVSLLVLCFIVTGGCLILHQRYRRRFIRFQELPNEISTDFDAEINNPEENTSESRDSNAQLCCNDGKSKNSTCQGLPTIREDPVVDIEDIAVLAGASINSTISCNTRYGCQSLQRESCQAVVGQYEQPIDEDLEPIEEDPDSHDPQILRHTVLLILLLCSMFVGLSLCIWTLVMEQISGIYVELSFLDAILNFGQSILVFVIFGLNLKEVVLPIVKFWRKLPFGATSLKLPSWDELSVETRNVCDQFVTHHMRSCKNTIATDKRWRFKIYKDVFTGEKLVDWLINVGLARDRVEAVNYGRCLIEGKVLKHINEVYHFYDRNLLYTFI